MRLLFIYFFVAIALSGAKGQQPTEPNKKGSYLYFGQPRIEDNSMLMEEAFNQEKGIIQHISSVVFDKLKSGDFLYTFTEEIPLVGDRFQFSYSLNYSRIRSSAQGGASHGFGDLMLSLRPMLLNKHDWVLLIPRFTLIVPTGNAQTGTGNGAWGGQFNLAATKRLNRHFTTHWNVGYTYLNKKDYFVPGVNGLMIKSDEANQYFSNVGWSGIYIIANGFNFMLEGTSTIGDSRNENGDITRMTTSIINPGFRLAYDIGKVQIVHGVGLPFYFTGNKFDQLGCFIHLSIETDHTK